jgi:hypothetical protein
VARGEINGRAGLLGNNESHLSDGSASYDCDSVCSANCAASDTMNRYGEWFNETTVERRYAVGKASDRRSGDQELIGHAAIVAHTENHAGSKDAAVIGPIDAGRTGATGRKWFKGDRRAVGECSGNLVTKRGLKAHREEMEIGTADPG